MTQELVYTSAPKGLRLGSRGFCTVASTPGMAKPLADRLEALSGYRHLFPPGSSKAGQNPVNFSFIRFKLGGKTHYVLSRVADAGLDYTQRTNKLAHHIVLESTELASAGPAWLLAQPGFVVAQWDGEPRMLNAARRLPAGELSPGPCQAWAGATGDAGWAGVLAGQIDASSHKNAYIIFPAGMDILPLVMEAQALLSPSKRWGATFSTYWSKLPPGVECAWRFVPDGTPESQLARRSPQSLLIDLADPGRVRLDTPLVETARTGRSVGPPPVPTAPGVSLLGPDGAQSPLPPKLLAPSAEYRDELEVEPTQSLGPPVLPRNNGRGDTSSVASSPDQVGWRRFQTTFSVAIGVVAGVVIAAFSIFLWQRFSEREVVSPHDVSSIDQSNKVTDAASPLRDHDAEGNKAQGDERTSEDNLPHQAGSVVTKNIPVVVGSVKNAAETAEKTVDLPPAPSPAAIDPPKLDIEAKKLVELPQRPTAFDVKDTDSVPLVTFDSEDERISEVSFNIFGTPPDMVNPILIEQVEQQACWNVKRNDSAFGQIQLEPADDKNKQLVFSWTKDANPLNSSADFFSWSGIQVEATDFRSAIIIVPHDFGYKRISAIKNPTSPGSFREINELIAAIPMHQHIAVRWNISDDGNPGPIKNSEIDLSEGAKDLCTPPSIEFGPREVTEGQASLEIHQTVGSAPKRELRFLCGVSVARKLDGNGSGLSAFRTFTDHRKTLIVECSQNISKLGRSLAVEPREHFRDLRTWWQDSGIHAVQERIYALEQIEKPAVAIHNEVAQLKSTRKTITNLLLQIDALEKWIPTKSKEARLSLQIDLIHRDQMGMALTTTIMDAKDP